MNQYKFLIIFFALFCATFKVNGHNINNLLSKSKKDDRSNFSNNNSLNNQINEM